MHAGCPELVVTACRCKCTSSAAGELWEKSGQAGGKPGDAYTPGLVAMPKEAGKVVQLSTGALLVVFHCFDQRGEQLSIGALCWPCFLRKNLQAAEQFSCAGRNRRAGWCSLRFTTHISQTGDSHTHSPGHTGMLGAHLSSRSQHLPPLLVVSMQATATHAC